MIAAVCAEEFVAKASYMGCRNCDYGDLCEITGRGLIFPPTSVVHISG
jgi:hypothetical protein